MVNLTTLWVLLLWYIHRNTESKKKEKINFYYNDSNNNKTNNCIVFVPFNSFRVVRIQKINRWIFCLRKDVLLFLISIKIIFFFVIKEIVVILDKKNWIVFGVVWNQLTGIFKEKGTIALKVYFWLFDIIRIY